MLQHLWTGPISNAAVDVVQGSRSVEVRPVGVSKGAAIERILGEIVHQKPMQSPIEYVMCCGHFLPKDEDIYRFFEPELSFDGEDGACVVREGSERRRNEYYKMSHRAMERQHAKQAKLKLPGSKGHSTMMSSADGRLLGREKSGLMERLSVDSDESVRSGEFISILDLNVDNYYSCAVGRKRSQARYSLPSSDDVVIMLKTMGDAEKH